MRRFASGVHLPNLPEPFCSELQYGATHQAAADGKEKHGVLGSKRSVGSSTVRICGNCNVTSKERHVVYDFLDPQCPLLLTTVASHERDIMLVKQNPAFSKFLGVTGADHAFGGIVPGMQFDLIRHIPYDHVMHSEAEGFLKDDTKRTLGHVFKSKSTDQHHHNISLNGSRDTRAEGNFNKLLRDFDWPEDDRHNKPAPLKPRAFADEDSNIPWTAAMVLIFAFHSIAILSPYVDTSDPVWTCWCLHVYYVAFAWKNSFTWDEILHLNAVIRQHHTEFIKLFPDEATPKFHWGFHMAFDIWLNGPLKHISCMRMEAEHRYWKRLISQLNFKGCVAETMGRRHARHTALQRYLHPTCTKQVTSTGTVSESMFNTSDCHIVSSVAACLMSIPSIEQAVMPGSFVTYKEHTKLKWSGQTIMCGSTVVYCLSPGSDLTIGRVTRMLEVSGCFVLLHYKYGSGLKSVDGMKGVVAKSLDRTTVCTIEVNTHDMTFACGFPFGQHLVLVV